MAPKKAAPEDAGPSKDEEEAQHFERTEQEEKCDAIFQDLKKQFKKLEKQTKPERIHNMIRDITTKLKEAKALIKDFERDARADGMPARELAERKKLLASELNGYIQLKKDFAQGEGNKGDLLNGAQGEIELGIEGMSMQQLVSKGKKDIDETDKALARAERIVEDTKDVGKTVAATLSDQTKQLEKIVDDLNEIEFTMKKASKVIRDITKGLLTDKCISFLLLLTVLGVVAIIVVKIINPNKNKIVTAVTNSTTALLNSTNVTGAVGSLTGRRMLEVTLKQLVEAAAAR